MAQALPGLEATALYHLDRDGFEAYSPAVANKKARLFPGYIFVKLANREDCFPVNRTRGIMRLLPAHLSEPLALPSDFVSSLMSRVDEGEFDEISEESLLRKFIPGEIVTALLGPMRDQRGQFLRYRKGCGVVLGYLLGKQFEYDVPLHQLKSCGGADLPKSRSAPVKAAA